MNVNNKNSNFETARKVFKKIKFAFENKDFKENIVEFEKAIKKLLSEYDTANWENRFIVGGALEILFCALLKSMGFECKWLNEARYDIKVNNAKFSMKSNFTGSGDIRLINVLGNKGKSKGKNIKWREPTLFFISGFGICYADPDMGLTVKKTGDALVLNVKDIREMVEKGNEWLIPITIPDKPKDSKRIKTASYDVVKSILSEIQSQLLINNLP